MKKNTWPLFLLVAFCVLGSVSCDKDGEPQPPTQTELLSSSAWKFQSATYAGADISGQPQIACFVDNTLTFTAASTYTVTEGTVICAPTTAGNGTWNFKPVDSLQFSTSLVPGVGAGAFKINSLTAANLVLTQNVAIAPSPTAFPLVVTFKH